MANIHQEVTLSKSPERVYQTLVDAQRFSAATGAPVTGTSEEGAAFSAFGGYITGRHLELVPGKRVVQAWRAKSWPEGLYSIARFELEAHAGGTKLVFDHAGFPEEMREHLAQGWQSNYWDNLEKSAT